MQIRLTISNIRQMKWLVISHTNVKYIWRGWRNVHACKEGSCWDMGHLLSINSKFKVNFQFAIKFSIKFTVILNIFFFNNYKTETGFNFYLFYFTCFESQFLKISSWSDKHFSFQRKDCLLLQFYISEFHICKKCSFQISFFKEVTIKIRLKM